MWSREDDSQTMLVDLDGRTFINDSRRDEDNSLYRFSVVESCSAMTNSPLCSVMNLSKIASIHI